MSMIVIDNFRKRLFDKMRPRRQYLSNVFIGFSYLRKAIIEL